MCIKITTSCEGAELQPLYKTEILKVYLFLYIYLFYQIKWNLVEIPGFILVLFVCCSEQNHGLPYPQLLCY